MKIKKETILKGFKLFSNIYLEFYKKIENENTLKETIDTWAEVFNTIDFDYEYANDDYLKAIKNISTKNKYIPTISEIIEEMKKINEARIKKEKRENLWNVLEIESECKLKNNNIDKALKIYFDLIKKYKHSQIIEIIKEYRKNNSINTNMILTTEEIFEKIMG